MNVVAGLWRFGLGRSSKVLVHIEYMLGHGFRSKTTKSKAQLIVVSLALLALLAYIIIMENDKTTVSAPRSSFPRPDLHAITKHRHPLV